MDGVTLGRNSTLQRQRRKAPRHNLTAPVISKFGFSQTTPGVTRIDTEAKAAETEFDALRPGNSSAQAAISISLSLYV